MATLPRRSSSSGSETMVLVPECKVEVKDGEVSGMVEWSVAGINGSGEGPDDSSSRDAASRIRACRGGLLVLNFSNKHSWLRSNSVKYSIELVPHSGRGKF